MHGKRSRERNEHEEDSLVKYECVITQVPASTSQRT